jgi:hypothetical protein
MHRLHNGQQVDHEWQHMTFANILSSSCILTHNTIILSTPMTRYAKHQIMDSYALSKVTYDVDNEQAW